MAIEFRCSQCGKLLRTDDGTTGRQAQCPECGAVSTVPPSSTASSEPAAVSPFAPQEGGNPFGAPPAADADPYQAPVSPTYLPPGQVDAFAAQRVAGPATALMVTAILGLVLQVGATIINLFSLGMGHAIRHDQINGLSFTVGDGSGINVASGIVGIIIAVVVLLGAMRMKRLESYGFAMASAILAMIPCFSPCCLLGLPFGIWALVVLSDGSVKAAFRS